MNLLLYIGASFSSFDELKQKIQEYEDSNHVTLHLRESKSLQRSKSAHCLRLQNINSRLKYLYVLYRCEKGGRKFISRRKRLERNDDCPMYIKLSMTDKGCLQITDMNERHNHEISEVHNDDEYLTNSKKRRLNEEEQTDVQKVLKTEVKFSKTGRTICSKDICSLKLKNRKKYIKEETFELENVQDNDTIMEVIDRSFETGNPMQEMPVKRESHSESNKSSCRVEESNSNSAITIENCNRQELPTVPDKVVAYCKYLASELQTLTAEQCDEIIEHVTLKLFAVKQRIND